MEILTAAPAEAEDDPVRGRPPPPQVFVRTFTVPPGLPWDQAKAAGLEARHGSPLPIVDLLHRLRRQEAWAPGAPGRYAAFYVRRKDYTQPFETVLQVEGTSVRVAFGAVAGRAGQARRIAFAVAAGVGFVVLLFGPLALALSVRQDAADRLDALEAKLAVRSRQAERLERERSGQMALAHARGEAGTAADVTADLAWIGRSKTPDARIVAVHWDRGLIALEARGEAAPISTLEREVVRAPKPVRAGVWLWGVARTPAPAVSAPAVAQALDQ